MDKPSETQGDKQIKLPIRWHRGDEIITRFASNMVIQTVEGVFKLSFFESMPEIRLSPTDKVPADVRADCVASIIVPPEKLPGFIEAMSKHLDKFNQEKTKP